VTEATRLQRDRKSQQLTSIEVEKRVQRMRDAEARRKWRLEKKFKQTSGIKSKDEPPLGLGNCVVVAVVVVVVLLLGVSSHKHF
jgi:hypothetical protein